MVRTWVLHIKSEVLKYQIQYDMVQVSMHHVKKILSKDDFKPFIGDWFGYRNEDSMPSVMFHGTFYLHTIECFWTFCGTYLYKF